MESTVKMLMTYTGRDKYMRIATYATMFLAGSAKGQTAQKWGTIARNLSAARVVMRVFDDLPMLAHTLKYGTGKHEPNCLLRILGVLTNLANQAFFPLEHIYWLAELKVIKTQPNKWMNWSVTAWLISLVGTILRSFLQIAQIKKERSAVLTERHLKSPDSHDSAEINFQDKLRQLKLRERHERMDIIKNGADLINAINWMPAGFLFAGKMPTKYAGLCGIISSMIGMLQLYQLQAKQKKS